MKSGYRKAKTVLRNESGISLVMVMLIMVLASVIAVSIMGTATNNLTQSSEEQESQSAYYIAEAGITKAWAEIEPVVDNPSEDLCVLQDVINSLSGKTITGFKENKGEPVKAYITIESESTNCEDPPVGQIEYKIVSEGSIGDRKRIVERNFTLLHSEGSGFELEENLSLYTEESINLSGGAKIIGNVATNSGISKTVTLDGGSEILERIFVPENAAEDVLNIPAYMEGQYKDRLQFVKEPFLEHTLPDFPQYPIHPLMGDAVVGDKYNPFEVIKNGNLNITAWQTKSYVLNLSSNVSFNDITVSQNNALTINVGSTDKEIVVNNFNLLNGKINLSGEGKLTIFVKNNMTFGSGSFNTSGSKEKLEIITAGSAPIQIAANMKVNGSLFAKNANLTFTGGGGFLGHLVTGGSKVTLSGGSRVGESLIFAPNAQVLMTEGGTMKGAIVSRSFTGTGGAILQYVKIDHEKLPFLNGSPSTEKTLELYSIDPIREK